jgi:hypothetical protein
LVAESAFLSKHLIVKAHTDAEADSTGQRPAAINQQASKGGKKKKSQLTWRAWPQPPASLHRSPC